MTVTGYIVDYGVWPDQHREYFTLRDCHRTIQHVTGGAGLEASIYAALEKLGEERFDRVYFRDDGTEMRVERCLIDANWGQTTDRTLYADAGQHFARRFLETQLRFVLFVTSWFIFVALSD
ncbi:MAG: hypothetical protein FWH27_18835 [Planctomycetaceae bacterium]|nr:hypothetical protein [Planctomycetaceae bacterium]